MKKTNAPAKKTAKKTAPSIRRLEELGATPAPWTAAYEGPWSHMVWSGEYPDKVLVATLQGNERKADSALIAAAPELYANLHEAVYEFCHACAARHGDGIGACSQTDGKCYVQRWRATLAKAAGAEGGAK